MTTREIHIPPVFRAEDGDRSVVMIMGDAFAEESPRTRAERFKRAQEKAKGYR